MMLKQKKLKFDVAEISNELQSSSESSSEVNKPSIQAEEIDEDILKYEELVSQLEILLSELLKESSEENKECVLKWCERLSELKKEGYDSTFIIGVIGRTRHGKSSLINALLEPFEVLPVSDTQSCTAVAVQIEKNMKSDEFEAEIEFFTKEEWDEELSILKGDFEDGKEDRFKPDTVAGMAYSKIEAVYGKFEQLKDLPNEVEILSSLGQTKTETTESASELRHRIENYIRAFSEVGNQYWPIVKKLTVRIPGNNTIVDGCTLVDLPGYGDDTAARVKVAEDFLMNCSKILVVSEITEALSNKYVRLNGCFGEQILRDLMESNLVFICTMNDKRVKVDSFVSELRREKEEDAAEQLQQTIKKINESLSSVIQEKDRQKLLLDKHRLGINARATLVKKKIIKNYQEVVEKWNRRDTGTNIDISKNNEPAVFCVSSDEYLNIKHKDVCQTFSEEDETEIPALKNHINQLVMNRKLTTKQHKIKKLDYIVTDIAFYLKEGNFEYKDVDIKECVNKCVLRLMSDIEAIAGTIEQDITKELSDIISKLDKGREKSEIEAMNTCKKWSQYHRKTYFAVLRRKGIFDSKTSGFINFNKDMIEPFTSNMTSVLSDFFNARFWSFMDAQIKTVQSLLEKSAKILCDKIAMKNVSEKQLNDIEQHLSNSVDTMLKDMEENLYYKAKNELKVINRFCEPIIQHKMMTIYARAPKTETGIAFLDMQDIMKRELEKIKNEMFQAVHDSVAKELENFLLRQVLTKIREVWKISLVDCFQFSFGRLSFTEQNIAEKVSKDISAIQMETSELSKKLRIDGRTQNT